MGRRARRGVSVRSTGGVVAASGGRLFHDRQSGGGVFLCGDRAARPSPSGRAVRLGENRCETVGAGGAGGADAQRRRSEEHTSELQSLMRISYAAFCLKNKNQHNKQA